MRPLPLLSAFTISGPGRRGRERKDVGIGTGWGFGFWESFGFGGWSGVEPSCRSERRGRAHYTERRGTRARHPPLASVATLGAAQKVTKQLRRSRTSREKSVTVWGGKPGVRGKGRVLGREGRLRGVRVTEGYQGAWVGLSRAGLGWAGLGLAGRVWGACIVTVEG